MPPSARRFATPNETKLTNCVAVHVPDATEFDDDGGRPVDMEKTPGDSRPADRHRN
jgi:hypothetical protein